MSDSVNPRRKIIEVAGKRNPFQVHDDEKIFVIGTFDTGVTVLSQQTRSLNLVWELIERAEIDCRIETLTDAPSTRSRTKVAIIGGGVSGLTVAAGLIKKHARSEITIFEQRDTLFPIQNGNETRWLHPNIYDWPAVGSYSNSAMLPLMNWTAARASDVVVQLTQEWAKSVDSIDVDATNVTLYCNTKHLKIQKNVDGGYKLEWVGERRNEANGTGIYNGSNSEGETKDFDIVILAIGFGLENSGVVSYWRNDVISQPSLLASKQRFIVSGQGDGAVIDLLRLRISNFRQDRIIGEIFKDNKNIFEKIRGVYKASINDVHANIFALLSGVQKENEEDFKKLIHDLSKRLRRDTEVILQIKVRMISDLFTQSVSKISFQNRVLLFLLYKCGGFVPDMGGDNEILQKHSISKSNFIKRRGVDRMAPFQSILSEELYGRVKEFRDGRLAIDALKSSWKGGYFGFPGSDAALKLYAITLSSNPKSALADIYKKNWRKEYLPGATQLASLNLCSCLSGYLRTQHSDAHRLRVTLHRTIVISGEELLQQCSEYCGVNANDPSVKNAGRTFPADKATIGAAYISHQIWRTKKGVQNSEIAKDMTSLKLTEASRIMNPEVKFLMAIPLLERDAEGRSTGESPVWGVIYIDSTDSNFFLQDANLHVVISIINSFGENLCASLDRGIPDIGNINFKRDPHHLSSPMNVPPLTNLEALDIVPPELKSRFDFNVDFTDFLFESEE